MIIDQALPYKEQVIALLESEKLPVLDLPEELNDFFVAIEAKQVIGVIGIEIYSKYGLLRSLAVNTDFRGNGIAGKLLRRIETLSSLKSLSALYLLTETAPNYFAGKGYGQITRSSVPTEVQKSSEFSRVCPTSAIVMKKEL